MRLKKNLFANKSHSSQPHNHPIVSFIPLFKPSILNPNESPSLFFWFLLNTALQPRTEPTLYVVLHDSWDSWVFRHQPRPLFSLHGSLCSKDVWMSSSMVSWITRMHSPSQSYSSRLNAQGSYLPIIGCPGEETLDSMMEKTLVYVSPYFFH